MPTRRRFLQQGLCAIGACQFPYILKADNRLPTLRVLGTHVTLQEELRLAAQKALGFNIEFFPGGSAEVLLRASTEPHSFDIYEQWSNSIRVLWQADTIKSIDTKRITQWKNINSLSKTGKISEAAKMGYGDAPHTILYVQPNNQLSAMPSNNVSYLPYVHNVDSFGYNTDIIPQGTAYESESWSWLFDDAFRGKVAIVNEPTIGLFDLALAAQAYGVIQFKDIGNISFEEMDQLFNILSQLQKRGHFRGVWRSVPHSVELMKSNDVVIESMFSPAVSSLRSQGIPCRYAAPREGYRAWHGVMCMSKEIKSEQEEMAYAFMNWWLSGWPGAFIARQGYYISNPEISRPFLSTDEWNFWYEGKATEKDLKSVNGRTAVLAGEIRSGGSYTKRFENIAVWNTVMPTYEYSLSKWSEFLRRQ